MAKLRHFIRICTSPMARARALRSDDRGQVMLLSGMMVFVVLIMTIFTFDTGKAIYNRIIAQNAVDSAADAAALWQARGCNLLQHLNNLHYNVNVAIYILESAALISCVAAPLLNLIPFVGAALSQVACVICKTAPTLDQAQEEFATAVMKAQKIISKVFPALAFLYGNVCAMGSGADKLIGTVSGYAQSILSKVGLSCPDLDQIMGVLGDAVDWLPLYAAPIDPTSLSLHVEEKNGGGAPWYYPEAVALVGAVVGNYCSGFQFNKPDEWGWDDSYYWGNPGFMTWIAGKEKRDELLGLGSLVWLNAHTDPELQVAEQFSTAMFKDAVLLGGPMEIPAFLAIASSQVEGEPVVSKGDANAKGHLITVHFPPDSNPKKGDKLLIYH